MKHPIALTCLCTCLLSACANTFLKPAEGSERVLLMKPNEVTHCQSLGKVSVNVLTQVGIYHRDATAVEANLLQLGQNNAIELGGDTLVKDETPEFGKQMFAVYKCKR
jgi:DTW domain-containing protein YfiP